MTQDTTTHEFQAETKKLLDIVINSLYTERDVFLRELISNSADALEKYRHQSLVEQQTELFDAHLPLEIVIDLDEEKKLLTITDTGIGMSKDELITNLGTIAHSRSGHLPGRAGRGGERRCQFNRTVRRRFLRCFHGGRTGHG